MDTTSGEQVGPFIQLPGTGASVSATSDGAWSMTVHDAATGQQLGHVPNVNSSRVAADGTLVGANLLGDIIQYDLDTLKPLGSFPPVRGLVAIGGLRFSADSTILTALSHDRSVSIYHFATRTRLGDPIPVDVQTDFGTSLPPDRLAVAIGGGDGINIWELGPELLTAAAYRLAGRNLTPTEWDASLMAFGDYRPTCPEHG